MMISPVEVAAHACPPTRVRLALAGCGAVGGELVRRLRRDAEPLAERHGIRFEVVSVLVRDTQRPRAVELPEGVLTRDLGRFLESDADVVVEAIGGEHPALQIATAALTSGRRLVTANKALLATNGPALAALARRTGARLDFEAAVGGGIPLLRSLRDQLAGAEIRSIRGVLNGTTNYVLTRQEEGLTYADALREAQQLGYAEADPSRDVNGLDAADKIRVLAWLAFGADPAALPVRRRGIAPNADRLCQDAGEMGGVLRLVAEVVRSDSAIAASVEPVIVAPDSEMGRVRGADNLVAVDTRWNGVVRLGGPGAGGEATASALLGDLVRGASTLRQTGTVIRGTPESARHEWLVSIRAGGGADRMLSQIAGRVGARADRATGSRGVVRAVIPAISWHRMELVMRMLLIAGVDPVVSRLETGSAAAPQGG